MYRHNPPPRRSTLAYVCLLFALCLTACLPLPPSVALAPTVTPPIPTATSTATPPPTPTLTPEPTAAPRPYAARVLIVSFDGLRPEAIDLAPMPGLQNLMQTAAYSLAAQTTFPSSTLPAHSSMLTGMCPSKHMVDWNDYRPERGFALGTDVFDLAHAAGLRTVMVVGKEKLRQVTEPASLDEFLYVNDRDTIVAERAAALIPAGFGLMLVHFALIDGMGHEYGWLSPEQLNVTFRADEALQTLLAALDQAGLRDSTLTIVTADHGGHDTTHGSSLPEDMTIPWIASGPGIRPARLMSPVNTMDTAATAAWALGLTIPIEWDGSPVLEAFSLPDPAERPRLRCG